MDGFKESFEREERLRDEMLSMYDELMYFKTYVMRENPALYDKINGSYLDSIYLI